MALPHNAVVGLWFVILVFPDHTHLPFLKSTIALLYDNDVMYFMPFYTIETIGITARSCKITLMF